MNSFRNESVKNFGEKLQWKTSMKNSATKKSAKKCKKTQKTFAFCARKSKVIQIQDDKRQSNKKKIQRVQFFTYYLYLIWIIFDVCVILWKKSEIFNWWLVFRRKKKVRDFDAFFRSILLSIIVDCSCFIAFFANVLLYSMPNREN